jgi:hypothetical protein
MRINSRLKPASTKPLTGCTTLMAVALACCSIAALEAQAPKPQGGPPTVKDVLYSAADSIGALRTAAEVDRIATMNYTATGTMTVDGKPCTLKEYRAGINWLHKGMRVDYTCEGQARRIEVVNGATAWNEKTPGAGATAAPGTAAERQLMIWTFPAGVIKAAAAAGAKTTVTVEGGKPVLAFPVVDVPGATMRATYNPDTYLLERAEARLGDAVIEVTYAEHGDWNGDDYLSDVQFPKRITYKRGGNTVLDLTIQKTNTYNPYVVMPVPAGIK